MKVLLLTDTPPSTDSALGQHLAQLCKFIPSANIVCFAARDGGPAPVWDPELSAVSRMEVFKPGESGLVSQRGGKAIRVAGMAREYGRRALRIPKLIRAAVAFGRAQKVDAVWAVLHGQTMVRMARPVAKALRAPLFTQVTDPFEAWLHNRRVDPLNRSAAIKEFRAALAESVSCATASEAMAAEYAKHSGATHVLLPGVDERDIRGPASAPGKQDELTIGFAGSAYLNEEWVHLVEALNRRDWSIRGRRVRVITYGSPIPPTPGPKGRVEHRHFYSQSDVIEALAAEADILYCPHPFSPALAPFARLCFPSKLATYFAAGKPVILHAPVYSSAYEAMRSSGAAVCVTGADAISLDNALDRLCASDDVYARTAAAGTAFARNYLGSDNLRRKFQLFLTNNEEGNVAAIAAPARTARQSANVATPQIAAAKPASHNAMTTPVQLSAKTEAGDFSAYVLSVDLKRAEALNAELMVSLARARELEQALRVELKAAQAGAELQGQKMDQAGNEPEGGVGEGAANSAIYAHLNNEALRAELEKLAAERYAQAADIKRAEALNADLFSQVQSQRDAERALQAQFEEKLKQNQLQLDQLVLQLENAIRERERIAHAAELTEVRSSAAVVQLNREVEVLRQEADRAFTERGDKAAEVTRLSERADTLQRELTETRIELAVQNVRLSMTPELVELRSRVSTAGALASAEAAMAKIADLEQSATMARDTLTAVQAAHVSEVRAGIEFISQQIAEAKEVKDAEARIAGRMSLLTSDLVTIRRNLTVSGSDESKQAGFLRTLYLDLLEASLIGRTSGDPNMDRWSAHGFDPDKRMLGRDWPRSAQTMIGTARLRNVRTLVQQVLADGIPGDLLEAGVWRGGACIYMRGILLAHGDTERTVWAADSFRGLPVPEPGRYPADTADQHHEYDELQVSAAQVRANFDAYGLLDDQVQLLEGWFKDTLPTAPIEKLAILRLDGDMYSSTMETLEALYEKVSPGGFIIVDDYILKPCRQAITDFRERLNIVDPIEEVDGAAVYWRKEGAAKEQSQSPVTAKRSGKSHLAAE